ncbi:MAG: DnaJ domain-containing protein [Hyphomonadaceae bacterium]|jgi:curved DNA-binding protein|nr:DnaJ domain-containing protein [Hyphomonadaceae bacterium]
MTNPYAVLGLSDQATPAQARAAFRVIAKTCHPDISADPDAQARFLNAQSALNAITGAAASADRQLEGGNPRMRKTPEIDLPISVWIAARGGQVRGTCALGRGVVKVPPGTRNGDRVLASIGGRDVACVVRVNEVDGFRAEGGHLSTVVAISATQARKGGATELETPTGRIRVKLPENLEEGTRLRVKDQGLPGREDRAAGDLFIDVTIVETVTDKAVSALDRILARARRPREGGSVPDTDATYPEETGQTDRR